VFDTLSLFNALTPKEPGVRRIARDVAYGADPRQRYDVYAPRKAKAPPPLLVFIHGGNWSEGTKDVYAWMGHALASMGYVVALPNYRLVPQVHYPDFVADCAAAVRHVRAHAGDYGADGGRLAVMGQSAGAYNAVMLALDPHYLGTDNDGKSPVSACVGVSGPYDFIPFDVPESRNTFGRWPRPEETQPIHYARKTNTRFLLMHSRADRTVWLKNSVSLDGKLRTAGTDCRLVVYEGLSHVDTAAVFSVPFRGKAPIYGDARAFLEYALG